MKKMLLLFFVYLQVSSSLAQSNGFLSHYMFNPLLINPAYAGFDEALTLNMMVKKQWAQVEGAPFSQIFSAHSPVADKVALGMVLANDQMGPLNQQGVYFSYAYQVPFAKGSLSLGLQSGATFYRLQSQNLSLLHAHDPTLNQDNIKEFSPNFGTGIFYQAKNYYFGLALPQLLKTDLASQRSYSLQQRKLIVQGSYSIEISEDIVINPTFLFYIKKENKPEMNLNTNLCLKKVIWLGLLYRNLNTCSLLGKLLINPQLSLGYAYDHQIGQIRSLAHASHEVMISYSFNYFNKIISPRYF
ncbi:MAG: PorP/SprF family type IX secretion system membrane protein [Candidatus Cyclobacteriaceae bacterium M3_2C_046]